MKEFNKKIESNYGQEILEGGITKTIFKLAWPVMLGNTMQVVYNLADTFWVGKLGAEAVAAVSISFPLIFLLISLAGGMTVAGTTLVAQYTGAGNQKGMNLVSGQVLTFVTFLAVIFSGLGIAFSQEILILIGAPAGILSQAEAYLNVNFAGLSFMFLFFVFSSLLRGYGDTKTPMKMVIGSTILNIVLDPFLIFGWSIFPKLGVAGAGLATVFSRAVVGIIGVYILFVGNKGIHINLNSLKPNLGLIKKIIKIGLPSAAEQSIMALGMTALMSIVSDFGAVAVAAYGIGLRILSVVMMPSQGFATATTTMVGQNIGADNFERAEKSTWISSGIMLVLLSLFGVFAIFFSESIIAIFNDNPEVIDLGVSFLQIVGYSFGFLGVQIIIGGSFRGAGNTVLAMALAFITMFGLRLPLAKFLADNLNWGASGIWWGIFLSNFLSAVIGALWFKRGTWKERRIKG